MNSLPFLQEREDDSRTENHHNRRYADFISNRTILLYLRIAEIVGGGTRSCLVYLLCVTMWILIFIEIMTLTQKREVSELSNSTDGSRSFPKGPPKATRVPQLTLGKTW